MDKQRIVITGMGLVSPLGLTVEEHWDGLINGKNGIGPITVMDVSKFAVFENGKLVGIIARDNFLDFLRTKAELGV